MIKGVGYLKIIGTNLAYYLFKVVCYYTFDAEIRIKNQLLIQIGIDGLKSLHYKRGHLFCYNTIPWKDNKMDLITWEIINITPFFDIFEFTNVL